MSEMVSTSAPCDAPGHCWAAELERETKVCRLARWVSFQLVSMPPPRGGRELERVGARLDAAHDGASLPLVVSGLSRSALVWLPSASRSRSTAMLSTEGGVAVGSEVEGGAQLFEVGRLGALRVGGAVWADLPLHAVQPAALLEDVRQLMRDEPPPLLDAGAVLARAEDDVTADGEGPRVGLASERGRLGTDVGAYVGEAAAEPRFEEGTQRLGQGLAAAVAQELEAGFELRGDLGPARTLGPLLHPLLFLFVGSTLKRGGLRLIRLLFFLLLPLEREGLGGLLSFRLGVRLLPLQGGGLGSSSSLGFVLAGAGAKRSALPQVPLLRPPVAGRGPARAPPSRARPGTPLRAWGSGMLITRSAIRSASRSNWSSGSLTRSLGWRTPTAADSGAARPALALRRGLPCLRHRAGRAWRLAYAWERPVLPSRYLANPCARPGTGRRARA